MAPSSTEVADQQVTLPVVSKKPAQPEGFLDEDSLPKLNTGHREPLKQSGALDSYESFDVTPIIGREFVNVSVAELLRAPNSDALIRDLAITGNSLFLFLSKSKKKIH
jgi:hypothetical protein